MAEIADRLPEAEGYRLLTRDGQRQHRAATVIQKNYRAHRAKQEYRKLQGAVQTIQAHARGWYTRKKTRQARADADTEQRFDAVIARHRQRIHMLELEKRDVIATPAADLEDWQLRRTLAAVKVQAHWRGLVERRRWQQRSPERVLRDQAARKIQNAFKKLLNARRVEREGREDDEAAAAHRLRHSAQRLPPKDQRRRSSHQQSRQSHQRHTGGPPSSSSQDGTGLHPNHHHFHSPSRPQHFPAGGTTHHPPYSPYRSDGAPSVQASWTSLPPYGAGTGHSPSRSQYHGGGTERSPSRSRYGRSGGVGDIRASGASVLIGSPAVSMSWQGGTGEAVQRGAPGDVGGGPRDAAYMSTRRYEELEKQVESRIAAYKGRAKHQRPDARELQGRLSHLLGQYDESTREHLTSARVRQKALIATELLCQQLEQVHPLADMPDGATPLDYPRPARGSERMERAATAHALALAEARVGGQWWTHLKTLNRKSIRDTMLAEDQDRWDGMDQAWRHHFARVAAEESRQPTGLEDYRPLQRAAVKTT